MVMVLILGEEWKMDIVENMVIFNFLSFLVLICGISEIE